MHVSVQYLQYCSWCVFALGVAMSVNIVLSLTFKNRFPKFNLLNYLYAFKSIFIRFID